MATRGSLTLWPSLLLVTISAVLIGVPLQLEGFYLNPIWVAKASLPTFTGAIIVGLLVRLGIHRFRTRSWPTLRLRECAIEAAHLVSALVILMGLLAVYCWGKLLMPWFRPGVLFDRELHAIERAVHLGLDPGPTLLTALQGAPWLDWLIDGVYSQYPLVMLGIAAWALTQPSRDDRHRWLRGFVLVWLSGLALYWLVPSLGPAFVFPDLAPILSQRYPLAFATEGMLLQNYQHLQGILDGSVELPLRIEHGIAAFPSLHVAVPAHAYFFAAERRHPLRRPLLVVTLLFVLGSVLTGWHYLIDSWAGIALGALCWAALRKPREAKPKVA